MQALPILPPNTAPAAFAAFLKACGAAVGAQWVKVSAEDVATYGWATEPFSDDDHMPGASVCPASLAEVQAAVAAAHQHRVPLWPISTGRGLPGAYVKNVVRKGANGKPPFTASALSDEDLDALSNWTTNPRQTKKRNMP